MLHLHVEDLVEHAALLLLELLQRGEILPTPQEIFEQAQAQNDLGGFPLHRDLCDGDAVPPLKLMLTPALLKKAARMALRWWEHDQQRTGDDDE